MSDVLERLKLYLEKGPQLGRDVFIARGAVVVGDVALGDESSVWFNAVLRADIQRIVVGHHTNIQDNVVLHLADELPCVLGDYVTVGHSAVVHGCTVGDGTMVGMGAVILDGARVGRQCLVGARALVTQGTEIPDGSLVIGVPARVTRALSPEEKARLKGHAKRYAEIAHYCRTHPGPWAEPPAGMLKGAAQESRGCASKTKKKNNPR